MEDSKKSIFDDVLDEISEQIVKEVFSPDQQEIEAVMGEGFQNSRNLSTPGPAQVYLSHIKIKPVYLRYTPN